jgi:hypothetical protein
LRERKDILVIFLSLTTYDLANNNDNQRDEEHRATYDIRLSGNAARRRDINKFGKCGLNSGVKVCDDEVIK